MMKNGEIFIIEKMNLEDIKVEYGVIDDTHREAKWKTAHVVSENHMKDTFKLSKTLHFKLQGHKIDQDKKEIGEQNDKVNAAFYDLEGFLKNLESLDEVFGTVRQGLEKDSEFKKEYKESEADKILEELGCIDVISKTDSGKKFYLDIARQIDQIFIKVLEKKGGVMSLIDVFLYYNRLRGSDLITTGDLLIVCEHLKEINTGIKLQDLGENLKVIQLKT